MIVDTSAIIAIVLQEEGWADLLAQAVAAPELWMSCGTLQELWIVASRKGILKEVNAFLISLDLDYLPVNQALALQGLALYQQYGKGSGHAAQLNFGDCFAGAAAIQKEFSLLYTGQDFKLAGF